MLVISFSTVYAYYSGQFFQNVNLTQGQKVTFGEYSFSGVNMASNLYIDNASYYNGYLTLQLGLKK